MGYVTSHHKVLKRVSIIVLILFFCLVGVGIFLRTDMGLNASLRIAQSVLEKQGMSLSYESVSGPLPTHLSFKGLRITDQKGTWFTANTVAVDIKLLPLVHGTLDIPHVILDDAYVARAPESSSQESEETTSGSASLPVDVTIENIEIRNVRVAQSLLFPPETTAEEASDQSGSTDKKSNSYTKNIPPLFTEGMSSNLIQEETKSLRADLSGKAGISDNKLVIALQGSVDLGNNEGIDIIIALDDSKKVKDFLDATKEKTPTHFLNREKALPEELRLSFPDAPQGNTTSEQWFALHMSGAIVPEGNLSKMVHLPNNSGGAFLLHGNAPLSDWKGSLGFALIDSQRNIPLEGKGFLQLALTGNSSLFSRNNNLEAKTAIIARVGKGYASLPSALGKVGYITASAKGTTSHISTEITVETAPWKLSARDVSVTKKDAQTSLMGNYSLVIPRLDALTSSQTDTPPSTPLLTVAEALVHEMPLDDSLRKRAESSQKHSLSTYQEVYTLATQEALSSLTLTQKNQWGALFLTEQTTSSNSLTQNTEKDNDQIPLFLSGTFSLVDEETIQGKSSGTLQTRVNNTEHSLDYSLHANMQDDTVQLKSLTIDGLGLSLHASGSAVMKDIANGNVTFDLLAKGKENAPWQTLVNSLRYAGQASSEQQFNGAFSLEAHAAPDEAHGTKGTLELTTSNMQWGTAQEQDLLGSSPHFSMNFLGGGDLPWEAHITECSTPFMSGTLDALLLPNEQGKFTQNDKESSPFAHSKIQATAQISLPNLTLLSSDLKGAVTLKALADGPLDNVIAKVTVASSSIEIPTGSITNILADLTSHISLPVTASTPLSIASTLSAQAKDFYGGNFSIDSSWTVKEKSLEESAQQAENPLEIAMPKFLATGAGLRLSGKGSGVIDSSPHLTGDLAFSVADWAHFSALTGIPLSGEKTEVSILLSPQPKQKITATLLSRALTTDDNSFSATSLSGTIAISDLFGTPQPFASLSVGDGHIGQLDWEKGTIQISPQSGKNSNKTSRDRQLQNKNMAVASTKTAIPISIVFSGKPVPATRIANKNQKNTHHFTPTDRVALEAILYPENSSLDLNSFGIYSPSAQAGLYLSQKSTIHFSPSLAVENLRMECVPRGSLAADVLFSPIKTSLDTTITDLPIERIGALAGAELPTGNLTISASLHRQNNKVEGNLSMQGKLASSATQKESATLPFSMKARLADLPDTSLFRLPSVQGVSHFIGKGTLSPHFVETKKTLQDNRLEATSQSNFTFDLPLTFTPSGIPLLATKQPFGFSLKFNGAIDPLWQVVSSPDRELTGTGDLNALYTGTFENPEGKLTASITNGQFEDHILGIFLTNIALHAKTENSAKDSLNVRASLFATDGKKLKAKGLLDQRQENGTIAIEALIGKKAQIIGSSVAKNLALRSGKESQKITEKERKQTSETKKTKKTSIDWTNTSEKKTTTDQEKTTQLFTQKKESTRQESSQNNNRIQKSRFRPIVSLADSRIADTDMAIALRGQIHNLEPLQRDDISLQLSGLLGVEGRLTSPHITGDLLVQRLEVLLELLSFAKSVTTLPIEQKNSAGNTESDAISTADIHIGVPGRAFIRGFGLDSEWQGDANITGKISSPLLSGSLHTIGGDVDLLSKPFEFAKGEIFFLGGVGSINPGIDIELVNRSSSLEAYIRVTGTASKPQFALASVPSLPKDEIVSQVLFSKRSSSLSRFEALQLADTLNDLFGESNKNLLSFSSVRKKIGIDVLRVNSGSTSEGRTLATSPNAEDALTDSGQSDSDSEGVGNLSIEAGKYITDNVYVGVEQNMQDGTGVKVDIELTPRTSIQGSSTQTSSQVGVGWKMDY